MIVLFWLVISSAFEMQSESPWLAGAAASALFPKTHLVLSINPAALGLLEGKAFSASISRPFGFAELDRAAASGGFSTATYSTGALLSYSGRNGYSEISGIAGIAVNIRNGIIGGVSLGGHRIQINGFGSGNAVSTDVAVIARPINGLFISGCMRGLYSSSLTEAEFPAIPKTISAALAVSPIRGVKIAAGCSNHEYAGNEYSLVTSVEPLPQLSITLSFLTPPVRMGIGFEVSLSEIAMQYGYRTHPELPGGHGIALSYGNVAFHPEPIQFESTDQTDEEISFPINVNTATIEELIQVPGIGPSKASTIKNYINNHGLFNSIDQLIEVPGIGSTTLENLREYLTV